MRCIAQFSALGPAGALHHTLAQVHEYILATIAHNVSESKDTDLKVFIDLDMAVIGMREAIPTRYAAYAANIRREYKHLSDDAYRKGRLGFLKTMLADNAPPIYASQWGHWGGFDEEHARANVAWEVRELTEGRLPGTDTPMMPTNGDGASDVDWTHPTSCVIVLVAVAVMSAVLWRFRHPPKV